MGLSDSMSGLIEEQHEHFDLIRAVFRQWPE
jgi:hypothetical protein